VYFLLSSVFAVGVPSTVEEGPETAGSIYNDTCDHLSMFLAAAQAIVSALDNHLIIYTFEAEEHFS
jgi:hypothetical protein